MEENKCLICREAAVSRYVGETRVYQIDCQICGNYSFDSKWLHIENELIAHIECNKKRLVPAIQRRTARGIRYHIESRHICERTLLMMDELEFGVVTTQGDQQDDADNPGQTDESKAE